MSTEIMIVEDDPMAVLKSALEENGYGVTCAADAETAIALVARHPPNLLLLDLILPGLDGLELLRRLRRDPVTRELAVVLTSGGGQGVRRAGASEAARTPRTWFVEKGAPVTQFLDAIAYALSSTPA